MLEYEFKRNAASQKVTPGASDRSREMALCSSNPNDEPSDHMEAMEATISAEDAASLIEPAISRTASRLRSPKTPSAEKAAAMQDLGGFFEDVPETPPDEGSSDEATTPKGVQLGSENEAPVCKHVRGAASEGNGSLPLSRDEEAAASPWRAAESTAFVFPPTERERPASRRVWIGRTRSSSNGADVLRRFLPKTLPSMAQVGSFFGTSGNASKSKLGGHSPKNSEIGLNCRSGSLSDFEGLSSQAQSFQSTTHTGREVSTISDMPNRAKSPEDSSNLRPHRPPAIRRVTSDDSLLYHSLSRASSLGDDTRFVNQHEQVNSRVKAIRDSLQDRSSFRIPQIPSMPRVPSFGFNMNFLNNVPARWRSDSDGALGILPAKLVKKAVPSEAGTPEIAPMPKAFDENVKRSTGHSSGALDRAMASLTGDIVIMGGYRGSILRKTKPPQRQVWVPVKVGLNIRKVNLEVGLEPEDEERMEEKIFASGMLQNIGPVDISRRLFKRLSESDNAKNGTIRVWDYGYDWRLSPRLLSRRLEAFLQNLPCNQLGSEKQGALVIAHSLGGLITRHVVNRRPELFAGVAYAGVPQSCINILGPFRNGDAVLLSSRVLTAQVNFTLRTSFVLLPEDGSCFIDINTKEKYPVDFFSVDHWIKYRFSPCTDPPLPPQNHPTGLGHRLNISTSLLSLPLPGKKSTSGAATPQSLDSVELNTEGETTTTTSNAADVLRAADHGTDRTLAPQMGRNTNPVSKGQSTNTSVSTIVTIPRDKAIAYLHRTLAETKQFKQELQFRPKLAESNRYPPLAVIYGKSIPTVYGAKVDGREGIPCSDCYDNLAFASGDGVCLAREAMLPEGYLTVYGGRIKSDRGHVTLLGDLDAVGKAILALQKGRAKGIGLGEKEV